MITQIVGWMGTCMLASAALPQLYKVLKDGHAHYLHWGYLLLIWGGLISMISYVLLTSHSIQLLCSYGIQFVIFSILIYKKSTSKEIVIK